MKKINDLLKSLEIKPTYYRKVGNVHIIEYNDSKLVIKKNEKPIYEYLKQRNFNYYPEVILKDGYELCSYIEDNNDLKEEKINKLLSLIALLHNKTTYYKKTSDYEYQNIYEDLKVKVEDIKKYYNDLMDNIESEIFMSPSSYLLARHVTQVFNAISYCEYNLDKWYKKVKDKKKIRLAIIHNNLELEHYIDNKLISWDKARFDIPIYDVVHLYRQTFNDYVWDELMNVYLNSYPLQDDELDLLFILISLPIKLDINKIEYENTKEVNNLLKYIDKTGNLMELMKKT